MNSVPLFQDGFDSNTWFGPKASLVFGLLRARSHAERRAENDLADQGSRLVVIFCDRRGDLTDRAVIGIGQAATQRVAKHLSC